MTVYTENIRTLLRIVKKAEKDLRQNGLSYFPTAWLYGEEGLLVWSLQPILTREWIYWFGKVDISLSVLPYVLSEIPFLPEFVVWGVMSLDEPIDVLDEEVDYSLPYGFRAQFPTVMGKVRSVGPMLPSLSSFPNGVKAFRWSVTDRNLRHYHLLEDAARALGIED